MISYSVAVALKLNIKTNPRIIFHEITKTAVLNAVANPRTININRVDSQQARAVLDLMVGFTISPLLWNISNGLSAGRCQTPALRLIVERENDITNFKKDSSWEVKGSWHNGTDSFSGKMTDLLESEEDATNYLENIHDLPIATIIQVNTKPSTHNAPQPLITSSLQQEASALFSCNPKNTMKIAQKLYESGLITYMRTDSTAMSDEAKNDAKENVERKYGKEYISEMTKTTKKKSDVKTQDAHECIRPTHFNTDVISGEYQPMEQKIYNLIYKRAIQSVMAPARGDERKIQWIIDTDPNEFIYEGLWKRITFQGWKIVGQSETDLDDKEEEDEQGWKSSDSLTLGKKIKWSTLSAEQKFSNPSPRFNEATLVRELEKKGIGRPSTFASLVASIIDKEYVKLDNPITKPQPIVKLVLEKPNKLPVLRTESTKALKKEHSKQKLVPTDLGTKVSGLTTASMVPLPLITVFVGTVSGSIFKIIEKSSAGSIVIAAMVSLPSGRVNLN
jgi:DNA topoisomerase-1